MCRLDEAWLPHRPPMFERLILENPVCFRTFFGKRQVTISLPIFMLEPVALSFLVCVASSRRQVVGASRLDDKPDERYEEM